MKNRKFNPRLTCQFQQVPDGEGNQLFGDSAIKSLDGRLCAATSFVNARHFTCSTGNVYSLDLAKLPDEDSRFDKKDLRYSAICGKCVPGNLQLGYDACKKVLYGVSNTTDQWYTVNTALARNTDPAKQVSGWSSSVDVFDLFDVAPTRETSTRGPLPALEPLPVLESLPVSGAAAASGRRSCRWLEPQTQATEAACQTQTSSSLVDRCQPVNASAGEHPSL